MSERKTFLSAKWHDLILYNYAVPDAVLAGRLPPGLELDRYQGSAFVSLVAFDFLETRVLGVSWPGHTNFAEINLRFYVRKGETRGVCFVRELVPQRLIALIARLIYNEPYLATPIVSETVHQDGLLGKKYRLKWKQRGYVLSVSASEERTRPPEGSTEHFFKEHEWGFGRSRSGEALVYRVEHPLWEVFPVRGYNVDLDFADVYGAEWALLNGRTPDSVVFAAGSAITVFGKD